MKTIALIRLLFTFSQRPRGRQLSLSLSPAGHTGTVPTSSVLRPRRYHRPLGTLAWQQPPLLCHQHRQQHTRQNYSRMFPECVPLEEELGSGPSTLRLCSSSLCVLWGFTELDTGPAPSPLLPSFLLISWRHPCCNVKPANDLILPTTICFYLLSPLWSGTQLVHAAIL